MLSSVLPVITMWRTPAGHRGMLHDVGTVVVEAVVGKIKADVDEGGRWGHAVVAVTNCGASPD